jgi:hypothetical protein
MFSHIWKKREYEVHCGVKIKLANKNTLMLVLPLMESELSVENSN